ncbi:MAG: ankyrin repeat domain-containing protein [Chloroflexi bacterium]|nr:ankyrin repeat domain-containing protein [Chloroflexota bacterium]
MVRALSLIALSALVILSSVALWSLMAKAATGADGPTASTWAVPTEPQQTSPLPRVDSRLYSAVWRGQLARVQELIAEGVEVNAIDSDGDPVLREAVWRGYTEIARALIIAGADVDAVDSDDHPLLRAAIWRNHLDIVRLMVAAHANVSAVDGDGDPLLHEAIWRGHTEIASALINAGADVDAVDSDDHPLLREAIWRNRHDIVQLMVAAQANVSAVDGDGEPLLLTAIWRGLTEIVKTLVDAGADVDALDSDDDPLLREAIWPNLVEMVRILVAGGADVDARDSDDDPLLHEAIWRGHTEIVEILVAAGVNVNVETSDGDSMLLEARWRRHTEIMDILVAAGATDPITPTTSTPDESVAEGTQTSVAACQVGMTLNEGDSCLVSGAELLLGTDQFTIENGRGCFASVCISGSVRVNNFSATQSGSTWTVVSILAAQQAIGPTGTARAVLTESEQVTVGETMTAAPVQGRIVARLLSDGRIEFGFQPEGAGRILPRARHFTARSVGGWMNSGELVHDSQTIGKISARRLDDGQVEFSFIPAGGERILPRSRLFPTNASVERWLQSSVIEFTPE